MSGNRLEAQGHSMAMPGEENLKMTLEEQHEVRVSIYVVERLLSSTIFQVQSAHEIFVRSALIDTLVSLRALMYKAEKYSKRISFSDDVFVCGRVKDVTDLIKHVRDAVCHPDSENHKVQDGIIATYNVFYGRHAPVFVGNFKYEFPYSDEVYFAFGVQMILLKRHIYRAFDEARGLLLPLLKDIPGHR